MLVKPKSQKNPEDSTIRSDKTPTNTISISQAQNLLPHFAKYIVSIFSPFSTNHFIFNIFLSQRCYPNILHLYIRLAELQSSHTLPTFFSALSLSTHPQILPPRYQPDLGHTSCQPPEESTTPDSASLKSKASTRCIRFSIPYWLFWPLSMGGHGNCINIY